MAYPHAVALANDVVIAARQLVRSHVPKTSTFGYIEAVALISAVTLYETEVDRVQPDEPARPCEHPRIAWVFTSAEHIECSNCGADIPLSNEAPL